MKRTVHCYCLQQWMALPAASSYPSKDQKLQSVFKKALQVILCCNVWRTGNQLYFCLVNPFLVNVVITHTFSPATRDNYNNINIVVRLTSLTTLYCILLYSTTLVCNIGSVNRRVWLSTSDGACRQFVLFHPVYLRHRRMCSLLCMDQNL